MKKDWYDVLGILQEILIILIIIAGLCVEKYRKIVAILTIILLTIIIINAKKNNKGIFRKKFKNVDIPEEFKKIFLNLNRKYVSVLENVRRNCLVKIFAAYLVLGLGGYFFYRIVVSRRGNEPMSMFLILAGVYIICVLKTFAEKERYKKNYTSLYKNKVVRDFIKTMNSNLDYSPECTQRLIMGNKYKAAGFDLKDFNIVKSDDYITGNLGYNSFLEMAELKLISDRGKEDEISVRSLVFNGVFAYIKMDKDLKKSIKITRNKRIHMLNQTYRLIEMDSQIFENYFDVYGDDKILTMRIITPELMDELVGFYEKYKIDFDICMQGNYIFMRFFSGQMFEPTVIKNSMEKEYLFMYYCIFKLILDVVEKIYTTVDDIDL